VKRCLFWLIAINSCLSAHALYGYSTVTEATIQNYGLNYTVGQGFICALTDEGEVVCDGDNNRFGQQNVPLLKYPVTQLSAGERHVCALDTEGVVCWGLGFNPDGQRMPLSSHPSFIAAGNNFTCASDSKGITCVGNDSRYGKLDAPKVPNARYIALSETGGCAVNQKSTEISCWGLYLNGKKLNQSDSKLIVFSEINLLTYPNNKLCFLTGDRKVACWDGGQVALVEVGGVGDVHAMASSGGNLCAIGEEGLGCINESGEKITTPEFDEIGTIAGGGEGFCGAGPVEALCWGSGELKNIDKIKDVMGKGGLFGVSLFSMERMEHTLVNLKEYVYGYKGIFLEKIAKHLEGYSISKSDPLYLSYKKVLVRALVLNAMEPFVQDLTTETLSKFRKKYSEVVVSVNQKVGIEALVSIDLNRDTLATSVVMIIAGLQASRRFMANNEDRDALESLVTGLGKVKSDLSGPEIEAESYKDQLNLCQELLKLPSTKKLFSTLRKHGRTQGLGLMITGLSVYLQSK